MHGNQWGMVGIQSETLLHEGIFYYQSVTKVYMKSFPDVLVTVTVMQLHWKECATVSRNFSQSVIPI